MERRVILSAALAHAATHSLELMFAALLLRIGLEFGADLAVLGAVANVGTFTYGATALPAGYLTDRFGSRVVISACLAAAAGFAMLVALAPNLWTLAVALSLLGAAIGLYHPAGVAMVSTVRRRRGLAFAAHGIAGNVGIALAPAIGVGIAVLAGWRWSYVALAVLALVVAALVRRIAPTRDEALAAAEEALNEPAHSESVAATPRTTPPLRRSWLAPPLLLVYLAMVGTGFIYRGSLTFLPTHLEENLGLSMFGWTPDAVAGAAATLVLLTAVFGQLAGGVMSDRFPVERAALPIVALNAVMLTLMATAHGVPLMLFAAGFVLVNFAQQPIFNALVADYAPQGARGRAFGLSFFMTFGLGSFAGTAAGVIAERAGTEPMFLALAAVSVVLALVVVAIAAGAERRRRELAASRATGAAAGGG